MITTFILKGRLPNRVKPKASASEAFNVNLNNNKMLKKNNSKNVFFMLYHFR